ncbi:hypothetical protein [Pseudoxanthomonas sp. PXM02]|uniref:hypothetical protein n=1 Tax=Pseudoxanthomonas sp. PXM02 TaxID=2769294 RepID=UPI00178350EE|nr:hypothetical protein [Pseudoxanthomonas sp. PXM02]
MLVRKVALLLALLCPASSFATSCGIHIMVVNHRAHGITVQLKSFHMDRMLPAPSPEDFDTPVYGDDVPPYLSSLEQVDVPAGEAVEVRFRRLCVGDFWLNWRTVPVAGEATRSGQLRPHDGQSIDIR